MKSLFLTFQTVKVHRAFMWNYLGTLIAIGSISYHAAANILLHVHVAYDEDSCSGILLETKC